MATPKPLPPWGSAVAGASGAVVANALVYPLDIVKTRLQVQIKRKPTDASGTTVNDIHYSSTMDAISKIIDDEGVSGLYSGLNGALIGVASTNFAYFYWYSIVRTIYNKYAAGVKPNTAVELSLGAVAGAIAQVFTIPVSVVTTRQQTQPKGEKRGLLDTGKEVVNSEDGWSGLWRGLKASLILVVNPAITYGAYQRLKDVLYPGRTSLKPWEAFFLGATSKALATIVTQPLIVAKVGLQSRPPPAREGKPFKTFGEVMRFIIEHEGPMALFKGIGPQITKGFLVQGLLMMTKERVEMLFILLFAYLRTVRAKRLRLVSDSLKETAQPVLEQVQNQATPVLEQIQSKAAPLAEAVMEKAKSIAPTLTK